MCPQNKVGTVDLYLVSHHGTDPSGSPALIRGLRPRAAVMQNGTGKGGTVQTATTLRATANFEDIWQLHWSNNALIEHNPAGVFIANLSDMATTAGVLTAPPRAGGGGTAGGGPGGAPGAGPQGPAIGPGAVAPQGAPIAPPQAVPAAAGPAGPATAPPQAVAGQGPAAPGVAPAGAPGGGRAGGGGGGRGGAPPHVPAYWIKISAQADGTFTVTNSRNNFSKTYTKR